MPRRLLISYTKVTFAVVAMKEISPATVVWLRFGIGVFILGLATLWRGQLALASILGGGAVIQTLESLNASANQILALHLER